MFDVWCLILGVSLCVCVLFFFFFIPIIPIIIIIIILLFFCFLFFVLEFFVCQKNEIWRGTSNYFNVLQNFRYMFTNWPQIGEWRKRRKRRRSRRSKSRREYVYNSINSKLLYIWCKPREKTAFCKLWGFTAIFRHQKKVLPYCNTISHLIRYKWGGWKGQWITFLNTINQHLATMTWKKNKHICNSIESAD